MVEAFVQTYAALAQSLRTPKQLLIAHDAYRIRLGEAAGTGAPAIASVCQLNALWSLAGLCVINRPPLVARLALEYLQWLRFGLLESGTPPVFGAAAHKSGPSVRLSRRAG